MVEQVLGLALLMLLSAPYKSVFVAKIRGKTDQSPMHHVLCRENLDPTGPHWLQMDFCDISIAAKIVIWGISPLP